MPILYPLFPPPLPGPRKLKFAASNLVGISSSPFTGQQEIQQWPGEWWELEIGLPPMLRTQAEQWVTFLLSLRGQVGTFLIGDPLANIPQGSALGVPVTGIVPWTIGTATRSGGMVTCTLPWSFNGRDPAPAAPFVIGRSAVILINTDASFNGTFVLTDVQPIINGEVFAGWTLKWAQAGANAQGAGGSALPVVNQAQDNVLWTSGWTPNQSAALKPGDYAQVGSGSTQRLHKALTIAQVDTAGNAGIDIFPVIRESLPDGTPLILNYTAGCFRLSANRREWDIDYMKTYGIDFKAIEAI